MSNYTFITGETFSITAESLAEAEQIAQHWDTSDRVEYGETMTAIYSIETNSGDEPNKLHYTMDELTVCYDTDHLVTLFQELLEDGYTGLSLGLVIDLIKSRLEVMSR